MLGLGLGLTSPSVRQGATPWVVTAGAAIDLDFVAQRYYWGGAEKTTANFTTFNLNGSTLDAVGLTPTVTCDITLSLSGLGTYLPGAYACAIYHTSVPAALRTFFALDDGTGNERCAAAQNPSGLWTLNVFDGGVGQSSVTSTSAPTLSVRHGNAASYNTNDFKGSEDGSTVAADAVGTLPTVTILRVGKANSGTTNCLGSVARVAFFTSVKTQVELNALSLAMKTG